MARPHTALIELAAGRPMPRSVPDPGHLLSTAVEHRMHGLLWSAVMRGEFELPTDLERTLAGLDLRTQSHHRRLWAALEEVTQRLGERGIEVATFKGVTAEARWYDRLGERPSQDLDLWVSPYSGPRAMDDVLRLLEPGHPLIGNIAELAGPGTLQSVDLTFAGVDVDLHWDPLKIGANIGLESFWDSYTVRVRFESATYTSLTNMGALISTLTHATRDRFNVLSTIHEARILINLNPSTDEPDGGLGLTRLVKLPISVVAGILDPVPSLGSIGDIGRHSNWRDHLWIRLWGNPLLNGSHGLQNKGRREMVLFICADGLIARGVERLVRRAFAPASLLRYHHGPKSPLWILRFRRLGHH